jgi:hypothetical protein
VLLVFKWTSDQPADGGEAAMQAMFEMRLFNDDLVLLFAPRPTCFATRSAICGTARSDTLALPMLALLLHMNSDRLFRIDRRRYGAAEGRNGRYDPTKTLEAPAASPSRRCCSPHPSARWSGESRHARHTHELRVHAGGDVFTKSFVVSGRGGTTVARYGSGFIERLLNPSSQRCLMRAVSRARAPVHLRWLEHRMVRVYLPLTLAFTVEGSLRRHSVTGARRQRHLTSAR